MDCGRGGSAGRARLQADHERRRRAVRPPVLSGLTNQRPNTPSTLDPTPTAPATTGRSQACGTITTRGTRRSIRTAQVAALGRRSIMPNSNIRNIAVNNLHALHPQRHRHDALVRLGEHRDVLELSPRGELRALLQAPLRARAGSCPRTHAGRVADLLGTNSRSAAGGKGWEEEGGAAWHA